MTLKEMLQGRNYEIQVNDLEQRSSKQRDRILKRFRPELGYSKLVRDFDRILADMSRATAKDDRIHTVILEKNIEIMVLDTSTNQTILKFCVDCWGMPKVYIGDKEQKIERSVAGHIFKELAHMYCEQESEKERKKEEEAAAKFEENKNAFYQNLLNAIQPNTIKK